MVPPPELMGESKAETQAAISSLGKLSACFCGKRQAFKIHIHLDVHKINYKNGLYKIDHLKL
jgi:hypothetical protein